MDRLFDLLAQMPISEYLRDARWGYASVNAAHILSLATLVGSVLVLDLKLIGLWHREPFEPFIRVLPPVAAAGLLFAVLTGLLLFSVRPADYAANTFFQIKLALIAAGTLAALGSHFSGLLKRANIGWLRGLGLFSLTCWIGALFCGRFIAYA